MKTLLSFLGTKWVVFTTHDDSTPELGLKIGSVVVGLYKADPIFYSVRSLASIRRPDKREFGESLHPAE